MIVEQQKHPWGNPFRRVLKKKDLRFDNAYTNSSFGVLELTTFFWNQTYIQCRVKQRDPFDLLNLQR